MSEKKPLLFEVCCGSAEDVIEAAKGGAGRVELNSNLFHGGLTPTIAAIGAEHGIRCCCVSPGPVLTRKAMNGMSTLLKRAADPQEIVDLILYLTGEKASFITGQNFVIDGGRLLMSDKSRNQNHPLQEE